MPLLCVVCVRSWAGLVSVFGWLWFLVVANSPTLFALWIRGFG
jgi:hypothetical protein